MEGGIDQTKTTSDKISNNDIQRLLRVRDHRSIEQDIINMKLQSIEQDFQITRSV